MGSDRVMPDGQQVTVHEIIHEMPEDKIVRKKARPAKVGELCVWDCVLRLSKIKSEEDFNIRTVLSF